MICQAVWNAEYRSSRLENQKVDAVSRREGEGRSTTRSGERKKCKVRVIKDEDKRRVGQ